MNNNQIKSVSRRRFLKRAGSTALAVGVGPAVIIPGRAQPKTLKIAIPHPWVPARQQWIEAFDKHWGEENNTRIIVNHVKQLERHRFAANEVAQPQGYDLISLGWSPALYEAHVIDHREVYQECELRYGKAYEFIRKSIYNPVTDTYYAFVRGVYPQLVNYRQDLWDAVDMSPDNWDNIRLGGRRIKFLHNHPVDIGLAPELDSNGALRALLYSFGGSVQDSSGQPALKSQQTLEAIQFVKALYEQAMTDEVLGADNTSNNRAMLAGDTSLTLNSISILRTAERKQLPIADSIALAKPPEGPAGRFTLTNSASYSIIPKSADNIDGAIQYLVDYVGHQRGIFLNSSFFRFPSFPGTVPDLAQLLAEDPKANPPDKYKTLTDTVDWMTNVGHPGYDNPAISEIFDISLIPIMFANAATGKMTPEETMTQADQEVRKIYDKWRTLGKV